MLYALSAHGKEIIQWISLVIKGGQACITQKEAIQNVTDEIKNANDNYAENIVTLRRLSTEWKKLGNNMKEKQQFIKDNKAEFDKLDVSIRNVHDAENLLVNNTNAIRDALYARAKATAAMQVAAEYYGKAIQKQFEFEEKYGSKPGGWQTFFAGGITGWFKETVLGEEDKETRETLKHIRPKIESQVGKEKAYYENVNVKNEVKLRKMLEEVS